MRVRILQKVGSFENNPGPPKVGLNKIGFMNHHAIVQEQLVHLWLGAVSATFISGLQIFYKVLWISEFSDLTKLKRASRLGVDCMTLLIKGR